MKDKKKKKWISPRHARVTRLLDFLFRGYITRKYSVTTTDFDAAGEGPYLILYNHQTGFDQFFVGMVFRAEPVYYVASEDIFTMGLASRAIKYLVNPIPIKKQSADIRAVINCMQVAREGGNIAIAPEGNRTFSGRSVYFNPAIATLAKKLALPIAFLRIEGGYGIQPRWSDVVRHGRMRAYVSRVMKPEEYSTLTDDALCDVIREELYVDEYSFDEEYPHRRTAERLERLLYVCPECKLSEFSSRKDKVFCRRCGLTARYTSDKRFEAVSGLLPFNTVGEWYDYQESYINSIDPTTLTDAPLYTDTARIFRVIPYKKKIKLGSRAAVSLFGDRIEIAISKSQMLTIPFDEASVVTVLGKNKLNIYIHDKVYQIKGNKSFNAVKYMNLFYRFKNVRKGNSNDTFLGI